MQTLALLETLSSGQVVKQQASLSAYFAEQLSSLTPLSMVIALAVGFMVGIIISFVYRRTYRGVLYSPSFALTLVMLTLITVPIVMCIKSDIALSLGMVGALSIVRFRTAVKDPMDTAFMFWALTMGILIGAELYIIAIVAVIAISIVLFLLTFVKFKNPDAYLLVVHYEQEAEYDIMDELRRSIKVHKLRSKTVTRAGGEMTIELRLNDTHEIVTRMLDISGVYDATLVACQTEAGA